MTGLEHVLRNAVRQRWLIVELTKRELKLRYRNSFLGFLWTLANPLVFMVVYTLVFSYFLKIGTANYPAFLVTGLLPWMMWFSDSVIAGTSCLVDHGAFLRSSVFPSDVLPIVAVCTGMMNYIFALPVMLLLVLFFQIDLGWSLLALPVVMATQFLLTLGIVFLTSTINVFVRDMRYLIGHFLMIAVFMTPVMYDFSSLPARFQRILALNPLAVIINSYRNVFFYNAWPSWRGLGCVALLAVVLIAGATQIFDRNREVFPEYL
ncbi:MAG: ABC transporter permease [Chloroflexi bacterium]|nr:ABC transporter permease [Chloroflexota bacterium]